MAVEVKTVPKTMAELESLANAQSGEIDISTPQSDDELVFEGGPLDGKRVTMRELKNGDLADEAVEPEKKGDAQAAEKPDQVDPVGQAEPSGEEVEEAETKAPAPAEEGAAEKPAEGEKYTPDFKLKVYDQESEFPEWAKKVCTSKETETELRAALQKSGAFDTVKSRHDNVVKERDEARGYVRQNVTKAENMVKMRDTNPHLFMRTMGLSDDAILNLGIELARAKDDPEASQRLENQIVASERSLAQENEHAEQGNAAAMIHQQSVAHVFSMPEVTTFQNRMDAAYGAGAFARTVSQVGSLAHQQEGYLHPSVVVQRVMEQYGKTLPQLGVGSPPPGAAAPQAPPVSQPQAAQPAARVASPAPGRVKAIPNVGRGTAATPVRQKMRTLADVEARVEAELNGAPRG